MKHSTNFVDLKGKKFNSWTVESLAYSKNWRLYWNCKCDCGNKKVIRGDGLRKVTVPYCNKCKPRHEVFDISDLSEDMAKQVRKRERGLFRNTFIIDNAMVYGYTSNAECFIFDKVDIEKAKQYSWSRKKLRDGWYVYAMIYGKFTYFHTYIMDNFECKEKIDHINRDKMDNRRANLRFCCDQENSFNKGLSKNNTSGFKGVGKRKNGKWVTIITFCRKNISLGLHDTKEIAASVYDAAAELLFGEFCWLNRNHSRNVPYTTAEQNKYVVNRCINALEGLKWESNEKLLNEALNRLYAEQILLAA